RQAAALGRLLAASGVRPSAWRHSGKERARQTAALLAEALGGAGLEEDPRLVPMGPAEALAAEAGTWPDGLALVAHQPLLGRLSGLLLTGRAEPEPVRWVPGTGLALERAGDGPWRLLWLLPPELRCPTPRSPAS
ncbi:MAG: hypothetical protein D6809_06710, partial [Gammaproteobacteria bacterium]